MESQGGLTTHFMADFDPGAPSHIEFYSRYAHLRFLSVVVLGAGAASA